MRKQVVVFVVLAGTAGGATWGCGGGDDSVSPVPKDGGSDSAADATADAKAGEGGAPSDAGDGGVLSDASESGDAAATSDASTPQRLLLSYNGGTQSELVAFGVEAKTIDGRLLYPGTFGTTYPGPKAPWLLEQDVDVVARLDPAEPWKVAASWNVSLNDRGDGGYSYADPDAIVVGAGTKAYVLRYTRNNIAVIDPSSDGGSPVAAIDLSSELQAAGDGTVEMSAGVYVPSKHLVYVLLANINRFNVADDGYTLLCANTHPTVIAIDVTTDKVVDLNGAAAGNGLSLNGYSPGLGQGAMAYDAQADRLLVLEAGCTTVDADGGEGALVGREVEELSLFTGQARTLLDLTTAAFPQQLVYIDANRAIVQLDTSYVWDPTTPALGPAIPNAPDAYAWDGVANLLGITGRYASDGGFSGYDIVSVRVADGAVTELGTNPFSLASGFPAGVLLWPAP